MSSEVRISARGLGKVYDLHDRPTAALSGVMLGRHAPRQKWALRDFGMEAQPGDFIGIIGRNGAGKSTLLEILAGTRTPSTGTIDIVGRVAALLELGAGFNPDFTGLENARLCAAAYGLSPRQISEKMPAIIEFSGVGEFMDRPTREYSSGMFARLAFSVCAHCDADILIVDEILGVGDVRFQQKSMRFLRNFARDRIVLFVSHNEAAVLALCNRAFWIDDGAIAAAGHPKEVVHAYHRATARTAGEGEEFLSSGGLGAEALPLDLPAESGPGESASGGTWHDFDSDCRRLRQGAIARVSLTRGGSEATMLAGGEMLTLRIEWRVGAKSPCAAFALRDPMSQILAYRDSSGVLDASEEAGPATEAPASVSMSFEFRLPFLPSGAYAIDVAVFEAGSAPDTCIDRLDVAVSFQVVSRHISSGLANVPLVGAEIEILDAAS